MKSKTQTFASDLTRRIEEKPESLVFVALSAPSSPTAAFTRVRVRPLMLRGEVHFQFSSYTKTQSFSENVPQAALGDRLTSTLAGFTQVLARFTACEIHGRVEEDQVSYKETILTQAPQQDLSHNRPKNYQLPEREPSALLLALGIQSKEGRVLPDKFDKFKQINRFLDLVSDVRSELGSAPHVLDFGCGKAYLTFALHAMLEGATITGIDARKDVIDKCVALKETLSAQNLHFKQMRIEEYVQESPVDLVLALHACDTATDAALAKAVHLRARVILVAPCCQHEVAGQIHKDKLPLILKHGLLKERFSALLTDALRAEVLNQLGYSVDLVEFIDPEHTPKNLLIRARLKKNPPAPDWGPYRDLTTSFGIHLSLKSMLFDY